MVALIPRNDSGRAGSESFPPMMNLPRLFFSAMAALALVGCESVRSSDSPKSAGGAPSEYVFYVGTSGAKAQGILRCRLDGATGRISGPEVLAAAKGASYLALSPDGKKLYATVEGAEGAISAYLVAESGLRLLNTESAKGKGATHLAVDAHGRNVLAVNYGSGSTVCLPVRTDGSLAPASSFIQHAGSGPNAQRQSGPHAHGVYLDAANHRAYVPDLGTDDIFIYQFDAEKGLLTPNKPKSGRVAAGAGPRHLVLSADGRFAYVCNEMALTVTAFAVGKKNGGLREIQTLPTLPEGADAKGASTAEIFLHASGRALYVSNRGHDSIAVYSVANDGKLSLIQHMTGVPAMPRGFGLSADGRWLVCAGQKSGTLNAYAIDTQGRLTDTRQAVEAPAAACVLFAR